MYLNNEKDAILKCTDCENYVLLKEKYVIDTYFFMTDLTNNMKNDEYIIN